MVAQTYLVWKDGSRSLPRNRAGTEQAAIQKAKVEPSPVQVVSTETIVTRNLFDPERGAGRVGNGDSSSLALQRIRNMVLMGTAIFSNERYAILQEPTDPRVLGLKPQDRKLEQLRLKVGDTVAGFRLAEINDQKVIFTKGAARVEVALDYFRKVEITQQPTPPPRRVGATRPRVPGQLAPRVVPNIPRRERLPAPPEGP